MKNGVEDDEFGNEYPDGKGINGFFPFTCHWNEHPDRDDAWAVAERGRIGEERFRREHGCEFLIYDETLINSVCLAEMIGIDPKEKLGQVRWYEKIKPGMTYLIALDPATGTGGDYSAIEIFELPTFKQVGEWHHNTTPVSQQIRLLRDITTYIQAQGDPQIYYSVENNTIGEAALISIAEYGEERIQGYFLSDNSVTGQRRWRKGFNTTPKSKLTACNKLKILLESRRMKVYSRGLISELKKAARDLLPDFLEQSKKFMPKNLNEFFELTEKELYFLVAFMCGLIIGYIVGFRSGGG